ncbi:hypothetical protein [Halalkalibacter oceani]|uniref:hypothetical protein n=1 Tax=Halalkalibacter oceani TaxID=1653776 RepID=UPI00339975BC
MKFGVEGERKVTAIISYVNRSGFSIILSDTREIYSNGEYVDGISKNIELPYHGWVSGAGQGDFLEKFKEELANAETIGGSEGKKDISNLYLDVLVDFKRSGICTFEELDKSVIVLSTLWKEKDIVNYIFEINLLSFNHFGKNLISIDEGEIYIVYPSDFIENKNLVETITDKYTLNIGLLNFNDVLEKMLIIFKDISLKSEQVSKTCEMGLLFLNEDGFYKCKISGDIDDLINDIKHDELFNRLKLVRTYKLKARD